MTRRRNPFVILEQTSAANPAPGIYNSLRITSPRKRNRQWEKEHQNQKAVYRGVDPKLALKVKSIAGDLLVPSGEVASAVIEYALRGYALGELDIYPRPNPYRMRMTLFPASTLSRARSSKQKQPEALWRVITTWRSFPPELKKELAALASDDGLNVPDRGIDHCPASIWFEGLRQRTPQARAGPKRRNLHLETGWQEMNLFCFWS